MTSEKIVCSICGSKDIEKACWVNPNKRINSSFEFLDSNNCFCEECERETTCVLESDWEEEQEEKKLDNLLL